MMKFVAAIFSMLVIATLGTSIKALARDQPPDAKDSRQGTLTEFDVPGANPAAGLGTQAFANNDLGVSVGVYTDMNLVPHGFIRAADGKITTFDAPGAGLGAGLEQGTETYSINDFGVIAGQFEDSNDVFHGFIRFPNGTFTTFEAPGAGTNANQGTLAYNINLEGTTAGIYYDASNAEHGFVRSPAGKITTFDAPDGVGSTSVCEETCLNQEGAIVGGPSFVREQNGNITEFSLPGSGGPASINSLGVITGYFFDSAGLPNGFVRTPDGNITTFSVPDSSATAAYSINLWGTVTGVWTDATFMFHGYSRSAFGTYAFFDAPDGGPGAFQGTRPSTNNLEGEVAGWVTTASGGNRGFVWQP
jgi:hypothetical protein